MKKRGRKIGGGGEKDVSEEISIGKEELIRGGEVGGGRRGGRWRKKMEE